MFVLVLVALGGCVAIVLWPRLDRGLPDQRRQHEDAEPLLSAPEFSAPSRAFTSPFLLELATPSRSAAIRYTLDGSQPTDSSTLFAAPIRISHTVHVAARAFDGEKAGPTARRAYVLVKGDVARFHSEIPIVLIDTFGTEIQRYRSRWDGPTPYVRSIFHVIAPDEEGVCRITAPASFSGRAGIRARGSSTLGREKSSFTVEIRDHTGEDLDVSLLGLPAESDWVLLGPLEFDRALMRNALVYRVARETGHYAPRTRFVEVFLNEGGEAIEGPVPDGLDYYGVYVLIEKIKRGANRVAIESMSPRAGVPAPVAGGYILKVDRPGPGDSGFYSGGRTFHFVYPKEINVSSEQSAWIQQFLDEFHAALHSADFDDPEVGYARYLDVDAAIDYHIINEFTKNPDSYVYSAYFHKPRDGKLTLGPVWDFDRTMGCDHDRRARNPRGWSRNSFRFWYRRLFEDRAFRARYAQRWRELRNGPFDQENLLGLIDGIAELIARAAERNTSRWGDWIGLRAGGWEREVDELKTWILERLEWYDRAVAALR